MKNNRFVVSILILLAAATIILALFSPMLFREQKPGKGQTEVKNTVITAKGIVESKEKAVVSSQVLGTIVNISVKEGDIVKNGAPLVMLDDSKVRAKIRLAEAALSEASARQRELDAGYRVEDVEIAKSRANLAEAVHERARDEYTRQQRLYERDATTLIELERAKEHLTVSYEEFNAAKINLQKLQSGARKEEIQQAQAAVEKSVSELQYYQKLLKDYTIISPMNGIVAERFKDTGETLDTGTPVLKIIAPDQLEIRAELEETDVGKVLEGQSVEVYTDAYKDKIYNGIVYKTIPSVKRKSQRTFDPMASFDINTQEIFIILNDFSGLKDGMSVTVRFLK